MEEHHHNHDSDPVYHEQGRRAVRLAALVTEGLAEHHYRPEAVDDDIAATWCLQTRHEVICYSGDPETGTHHCVLPSMDAARDYFSRLEGCDLRTVWL